LIAQAHSGTLFLDEIGELPLSMQKAFLRVLQKRSYRPVGGQTELESNFRLVAATTRNLEQMVEEGRFRKDLLLRLCSLTIELPPLRERPQDVADLVRFHTQRLCESYDLPKKGFSVELLDLMAAYSWPGNVRELVQTVDAMLSVAARESTLHARHLPVQMRIQVVCSQLREPKVLVVPKQSDNGLPDFKTYRSQAERRYLADLLRAAHRNIPKACAISGISRSRLYEMLSKHDLIGPG
jgi:two-component system, NtrC family, response regulator